MTIKHNLEVLQFKIEKYCKIYNKKAALIDLVAVSKKQSKEKIYQAIDLGCKCFGENYIKETKEKWSQIRKDHKVTLHFIGHLQSNKAKDAVELFDVIETVDSKKLALEISKAVKKLEKNPDIFIQVNIGEEEQKGGVYPSEVNELVRYCQVECQLNVVGLMCIPPSDEEASPYFALLSEIAKENGLERLSMGMSSDFEQAIACGTSQIRIGTALFGSR
ncbi:MAG: YggS family pyridoxal phosphate-dependent enzyme [Rickettsiales bacterium]|nr:YggS family pyridoxal phosphate-dependent enzyme [Rickettsiales bacterium]